MHEPPTRQASIVDLALTHISGHSDTFIVGTPYIPQVLTLDVSKYLRLSRESVTIPPTYQIPICPIWVPSRMFRLVR